MRDRYVFIWQLMEILNVFNTLTFKRTFWQTKTFSKNWSSVFIVRTKIKNTIFSYKTALSEASIKTNRVGEYKMDLLQRTKFCHWLLNFLKFLLQFKNILLKVDLMYQLPKCPYSYFFQALEFYLNVLFPY